MRSQGALSQPGRKLDEEGLVLMEKVRRPRKPRGPKRPPPTREDVAAALTAFIGSYVNLSHLNEQLASRGLASITDTEVEALGFDVYRQMRAANSHYPQARRRILVGAPKRD